MYPLFLIPTGESFTVLQVPSGFWHPGKRQAA
jgi:hypothetical protein